MTKIDKKGTLLDLTDLMGIEKIYKEEKVLFLWIQLNLFLKIVIVLMEKEYMFICILLEQVWINGLV